MLRSVNGDFQIIIPRIIFAQNYNCMAKLENHKKQNPKLRQSELSDGRASLYLEYYLGRSETSVLDKDGNQVFYTEGAMAGKPKYQIKHSRKKETRLTHLNFLQNQNFLRHKVDSRCPIRLSSYGLLPPSRIPLRS